MDPANRSIQRAAPDHLRIAGEHDRKGENLCHRHVHYTM
ncbi:Uncharacterised protein [Mycobacteroides abscessus subsp. abscessus]|nr:hypothetical protein MA3A0930S_4610 [Mycobacteroides abscessus 3A-0930-S]SHT92812.1 Uncharacterised protein [Mycobacteroides abscessus subsp. abscessus]